MQTILGAGGTIGRELAKVLPTYDKHIRLVSRNPQVVNPDDEVYAADLLEPTAVEGAVAGSDVVYLTAGFPYRTPVWRATWPQVMDNVLAACQKHQAKLVFFDNVYMYDPAHMGQLREDSPINPPSQKGQVRAAIAAKVLDAHANGQVQALIARAADFYGPNITQNGMLNELAFKKLAQGGTAQWLASTKYPHAFTYTPDAGRDTALLGNSDDAYGQVWHLPTAPDPPTGQGWVEAIADALQVQPKVQVIPKWLVRTMGWVVPMMRELDEMMYQYDRSYVVDSSKFSEHFGVLPTPYAQGIAEVVSSDHRPSAS